MMIEVLKSKLHCVKVTEANLNYMGSITIDEDLMDAANLISGEKVQIVDNNNGERFETYIIKGEKFTSSQMDKEEEILDADLCKRVFTLNHSIAYRSNGVFMIISIES